MTDNIKEVLKELKFNIELEESCVIYRKKIKTKLFGLVSIDVFEGDGAFGDLVEIVVDLVPMFAIPISEENIKLAVNELKKMEVTK